MAAAGWAWLADWSEELHPRGEGGKFTTGDGVGEATPEPDREAAYAVLADNEAETPEQVRAALDALGAEKIEWGDDAHANPVWVVESPTAGPGRAIGDLTVVEWDGEDTYTDATNAYEWVGMQDPADYFPNYDQEWNDSFWSEGGMSTIWHATTDDHIDSVVGGGLETRSETRGLSNRSEGPAVYTSTNDSVLDAYGDAVVAIDLDAMRRDGVMPFASQEPDVANYELFGAIAYRLGLEDYSAEVEGGMDWDTVVLYGDVPAKYVSRQAAMTASWDESLHPRGEGGRFGESGGEPDLKVRDFDGEVGNRDHITRREEGTIPTSAIALLDGVAGEKPGEHGARQRSGDDWSRFLDSVREHGITEPIFVTVDHGEAPKISEGNTRRDAAVELGLPSVPVEISYFGHAEQEGSVVERASRTASWDESLHPRGEGGRFGEKGGDGEKSDGPVRSLHGVAVDAPGVYWHGTPSGDLRGSAFGLHLGTFQAAQDALNARIGKPAEGVWDGTREYGETLLYRDQSMSVLDPETRTWTREVTPVDPSLPSGKAVYSDGSPVALDSKPDIMPFRIVGNMTNSADAPHEDFKANGYMHGQITRGTARSGYFYTNVGEDEGSVSVVVPNGSFVERVGDDPREASARAASWDEALHPRGEGGKFTTGDGFTGERDEGQPDPVATLAASVADRAAEVEPDVSATLRAVVPEPGELVGFDFRMKKEDRIADKIADKIEEGQTPEEAAAAIKDALRYTVATDPEEYTDVFAETRAALAERGYTLVDKERNYWERGDAYSGMNTFWQTADGQKFEVQFHTPESYALKEAQHPIFQQMRATDDPQLCEQLYRESSSAWDDVPIPDGIMDYGVLVRAPMAAMAAAAESIRYFRLSHGPVFRLRRGPDGLFTELWDDEWRQVPSLIGHLFGEDDDHVEVSEDEARRMGALIAAIDVWLAGGWDESLHPRGEGGRFGEKTDAPEGDTLVKERDPFMVGSQLADIAKSVEWGEVDPDGLWGTTNDDVEGDFYRLREKAKQAIFDGGYNGEGVTAAVQDWSYGQGIDLWRDVARGDVAPGDVPPALRLLAEDDPRTLKMWEDATRGAGEALEIARGATIDEPLYRQIGVTAEAAASIHVGQWIEGMGAESWSRDEKVAGVFGQDSSGSLGDREVTVRLETVGASPGLDIVALGAERYAWQQEVIVPADAYEVVSISGDRVKGGEGLTVKVQPLVTRGGLGAAVDDSTLSVALFGETFGQAAVRLGHDEPRTAAPKAKGKGRFDKSKHDRDGTGRFAKQPGAPREVLPPGVRQVESNIKGYDTYRVAGARVLVPKGMGNESTRGQGTGWHASSPRRELLRAAARLARKFPTRRATFRVSKNAAGFQRKGGLPTSYGYVIHSKTSGVSVLTLHPSLMDPATNATFASKAGSGFFAPVATTTNVVEYVATHEYGHSVAPAEKAASPWTPADGATAAVARAEAASGSQVLSGYGRTDPVEAFADGFLDHFLAPGTDPFAEALAKDQGWR